MSEAIGTEHIYLAFCVCSKCKFRNNVFTCPHTLKKDVSLRMVKRFFPGQSALFNLLLDHCLIRSKPADSV